MEDFKSLFSSRTVWMCLVAILATALKYFGFEVDDATQSQIVDSVLSLVAVVSTAGAILFRVKATKQIGKSE